MSINVMHAKPDLRVVLKWMINRSGSVITAVIPLNNEASFYTEPVSVTQRPQRASAQTSSSFTIDLPLACVAGTNVHRGIGFAITSVCFSNSDDVYL